MPNPNPIPIPRPRFYPHFTPMTQPSADKDLPLKGDTRLLGRLLGDTVREQEGEETFQLIERIRQSAVRFRRGLDLEAGEDLRATLKGLSAWKAILVVRAFSYFSHLANLAEDQHHIRRSRSHRIGGAPPRPSPPAAFGSGARLGK